MADNSRDSEFVNARQGYGQVYLGDFPGMDEVERKMIPMQLGRKVFYHRGTEKTFGKLGWEATGEARVGSPMSRKNGETW
ncbi:MAG: hypothetical protein WB729_05135, partial [Candidatus Sulfotelmatobacter sp.]